MNISLEYYIHLTLSVPFPYAYICTYVIYRATGYLVHFLKSSIVIMCMNIRTYTYMYICTYTHVCTSENKTYVMLGLNFEYVISVLHILYSMIFNMIICNFDFSFLCLHLF